MPGLDNLNSDEIILDENSNENLTTSLIPISTSPLAFQKVKDEARNDIALHTLFHDNKSATSQCKLDNHFQDEGDAIGWGGESAFQENKVDEEERRITEVKSEVNYKAIDEKWRGAINGLQEHKQMTPQSLDVQIIEDRIDKARLDLNFLEQQTTQMEIEMKTLQMELAKLKDQLCQTQIQYDE